MRRALSFGIGLGATLFVGAAPVERPTFTDFTEQAGIAFKQSFGDHELDNIVEGTGTGACLLDFDGDGWLDIYFPNGRWQKNVSDNRGRDLAEKLKNALYRNNHDGTYRDATDRAGVAGKGAGFGCSAADYDDDGDVDLLVLGYGGEELYRNNGDGTFTDVTAQAGLSDPYWSLNAAWLDYDRDGDLDVFVCNYLQYDDGKFRAFYAAAGYPGPLSYSGVPSTLWRNDGHGTFTDVTREAGVYNPGGRGMSAVAVDLNNDGLVDIYQANDSMESYYYENKGNGTFEEKALFLGLAFGQHGQGVSHMGPAIGDVDRDGRFDILIPDMDYGSLMMNRGSRFRDDIDRSNLAVICGQYTGWGGVLFDYDNDGYLDVFIANGNAHHEYPEDPVLARNDGTGVFVDVARDSGAYFQKKYVARAATYGDLDNDGDVDLLVVDLGGPPHLLRNDGGNRNHWLKLDVRTRGGKRAAIGARVTVTANGLAQIEEVAGVRGYLSQGDVRAHFGLGAATKAERVEIRWPDGRTQLLTDVAADQTLTVAQEPAP